MLDYAGLVLTFFISIMQVKDPPQVRMCRKDCGLPCRLSGKESACNVRDAGDMHLIPGLVGEIPWRRACNPLQYSCLENPVDRGAWPGTTHGVAKSQT